MKPERSTNLQAKISLESEERTTLDDVIEMGDIAENIHVSKIIDTERGLLCYVYD